jgi:hypothetical protein
VVLVAGLLALGVAFAIAAWFVVREAIRLAHEPPPVLFSLDEAYEWVVERVPDLVAATLTPDDVRRILGFVVEYLSRAGVAANGSGAATNAHAGRPAVVGAAELVGHVLERAAATGDAYIPEQVYPVVEIVLEYLRATGAVSAPADRDPPLS